MVRTKPGAKYHQLIIMVAAGATAATAAAVAIAAGFLATTADAATGPADNGRALTPPQGWRHWNQWTGAISQVNSFLHRVEGVMCIGTKFRLEVLSRRA